MRPEPTAELPPITPRQTDTVTQVREYRLITPLFGGGVKPAEMDPVTPIRGTAVRGQLRFWWRATRGGRYNGDLEKMKAAEDALWGAASTPGKVFVSNVQLSVQTVNRGKPFVVKDRRNEPISIAHFRSPYSYAAFPLEPDQTVQEGITFQLSLGFPAEFQADVEAALWAWETFGGIGGRTRRGFGSLQCVSLNGEAVHLPADHQISKAIKMGLKRFVLPGDWSNASEVPHLSPLSTFVITEPLPDPLAAWRNLLSELKAFRQSRNPGTATNRPGRSHWPEPDAIRRLTRKRAGRHATPLSTTDKFPRAQFGLPIIFHFKDQDDPADTSLQGVAFDRLASPLILRPIACNGNSVGLALILEGPRQPKGGLLLKGAPGGPRVKSDLQPAEAARIKPLAGNTDILQAFLDTLD